MGKKNESANSARIKNLADGPRDYPLKSGASLYLAAKGKTSGIAYIPSDEISDALLAAESKGLVKIERMMFTPASEDVKEANG